jgi:hypothetical protein
MLTPDFSQYSLAVYEKDKLIYSSRDKGLWPLYDCLKKLEGKYGLVLHDKVIGLAAARLVVYSGMIARVITTVASLPAKDFLEQNNIIIMAHDIAANIMTRDGSAICPGEIIALDTKSRDDFLQKIKTMLDSHH